MEKALEITKIKSFTLLFCQQGDTEHPALSIQILILQGLYIIDRTQAIE